MAAVEEAAAVGGVLNLSKGLRKKWRGRDVCRNEGSREGEKERKENNGGRSSAQRRVSILMILDGEPIHILLTQERGGRVWGNRLSHFANYRPEDYLFIQILFVQFILQWRSSPDSRNYGLWLSGRIEYLIISP